MKKFNIIIIIAIMLPVFIYSGCKTEDDTPPLSMTFADNLAVPAKEFTIDENLGFKVKFITPTELEAVLQVKPGDVISGRITDADDRWNSNLTGVADQMTATNPTFASVMPAISVVITLDYIKDDEVITAVTVALEGTGIAETAQALMGGTYFRKP